MQVPTTEEGPTAHLGTGIGLLGCQKKGLDRGTPRAPRFDPEQTEVCWSDSVHAVVGVFNLARHVGMAASCPPRPILIIIRKRDCGV